MTFRAEKIEKPRPAATVILVREHGGTLQCFLLKRNPESKFFAGNFVFPGGAVSSQDLDLTFWLSHTDLTKKGREERFGRPLEGEGISGYAVSAVRETFEEAGILLGTGTPWGESWFEDVCTMRVTEGLPGDWLRQKVSEHAILLGFSMLFPWSHWITPEAMIKRFDTRFFVARVPPGQVCSPDRRETVEGRWMSPEEALEANLKGAVPLSPPTLVTLHQFLPYARMAELESALKVRKWGETIFPRMIRFAHGAMIIEPWDPMYGKELEVDEDRLEEAVLPVGEPFSRIWFHKGLWRAVGPRCAKEVFPA